MGFIVGTSGYSYAGWKGSFYPSKLPQKEMLHFYSQQFATVELNNTFYRLPDASVVKSWSEQVPPAFRFAVKAPQAITHRKRLKNVERETDQLFRVLSGLKRRQGPLLFQLPPNFKKDLPRLKAFLQSIEDRASAAFEFRHESWFDEEVFECLRRNGCALCIADIDGVRARKPVSTANWGYVRLRRETYTNRQLRQWIEKLRAQNWRQAYVYFKHDDVGLGPRLAVRFSQLAAD